MPRIVSTQRLTERITAFEIEAPAIAAGAEAGQIVLARFDPLAAWTPKAIAEVDRGKETMTFLSRDGRCGQPVTDIEITGPLGSRKAADKAGKVLFVAEGAGIGAVLPRLRELKDQGCYTMVIAAYPSKSDLFWVGRLNDHSDELYIVTDDGSYGIKGPLRHTLKAVCEQIGDIDLVHAAGPLRLLKTTADVAVNFNIPATVSLATVLDDAESDTPGDVQRGDSAAVTAGTREGIDWASAIDLDARDLDFDDFARRLGFPLTK
jgi:ferredoxin--NADP+ reductase